MFLLFIGIKLNAQDSITDIDGFQYSTVQIGNQTWLQQNLRTTRYNDGTPISIAVTVDTPGVWDMTPVDTIDKYTYYNLDLNLERYYGKLYNGYVVNNDKNICPCGFKVPNDAELTELILQVDPNANTDTLLWDIQSSIPPLSLVVDSIYNTIGTNETGFSLLMAGVLSPVSYDLFSGFFGLNGTALLWSTTPAHGYEDERNYTRYIDLSGIYRYKTHWAVGAPIRCIKDVAYDCQTNQIEEIKIDYTVYPNPVVNELNIVVDQSNIGSDYTISDMNGKILISGVINSQQFQIDMSKLSNGSYMINVGGGVKIITK
jgi:uncharacterized protein (TIGR02145 family)